MGEFIDARGCLAKRDQTKKESVYGYYKTMAKNIGRLFEKNLIPIQNLEESLDKVMEIVAECASDKVTKAKYKKLQNVLRSDR